jgi:metallo-beta-lactamase family protein
VPYGQSVPLGGSLSVTFFDAGHILGSAMLEVRSDNGGAPQRLLFSGDVGQWDKPLIRDPTLFREADWVVMESTYGDRLHEDGGDIESQLARVVSETVERGGNVVIPTFAVERAQELLFYLGRLRHAGRIPHVPVFLDSPMARDVTEIFRQFEPYLDAETLQLILSDQSPLRFPGLKMVRSVEESKAINQHRQPCVVMASSGMCTAGRIKFHLRYNIERPESTILFVGYQGEGTLGRLILDRKPTVRIHGRMHRVLAQVAQIHGFSGHADRNGLLRWLGHLRQPPRGVFLTHGEEQAALNLAETIGRDLGWPVTVPEYQSVVEL